MKQDKIHCLDEKVSKPLIYKQALAILREMHFGACVIRSGRNRGSKRIWWTTEKGENYYQMFLRETSWEYIIEVAKQQIPVWDNAMLFEVGDLIDFEWFNGRKCQGTILERDDSRSDYLIESLAFLSRRDNKRRVTKRLTNYDLKFYRKAVKVETDEEIVEESDCPKGAALSCDSEALLRSPYSPSGILRQALPLAKRGEAQASADRNTRLLQESCV